MSVHGGGEAEEGVEGGGKRGGGRGMTNPGRWLGCQWQVNIDVEEVFFFIFFFSFFAILARLSPIREGEEAGEEKGAAAGRRGGIVELLHRLPARH